MLSILTTTPSVSILLLATLVSAAPTHGVLNLFEKPRYVNMMIGEESSAPQMLAGHCSNHRTREPGSELQWGCTVTGENFTFVPRIMSGPSDIDMQLVYDAGMNTTIPYTAGTTILHLQPEECPIEPHVYTCGAYMKYEVVRIGGVRKASWMNWWIPVLPHKDFYIVEFPRIGEDKEEDTYGVIDAIVDPCVCPNFPGAIGGMSIEMCPNACSEAL